MLSVDASLDAVPALERAGLHVDEIVVNRLLPEGRPSAVRSAARGGRGDQAFAAASVVAVACAWCRRREGAARAFDHWRRSGE